MQSLTAAAWYGAASLAAPGLRLMLRRRAARGKELPHRLPERRGIDPAARPLGRLLWLHAASVGESRSVLPVLQALPPDLNVLFTTGTVTSAALLAERLPALGLHRVVHRFVPLDVPAWAARFLDHWQPDAAAFVESELWPNLLAACRDRGIPAMLVNARMSARSARGWSRAPGFARRVLGGFCQVQAQSVEDAARLQALGARNVTAPGNLKLAAPPLLADPVELARLQRRLDGRPVWLAASTHPGEDEVALAVHRALAPVHPGLLTIVAPRHPARGAEVAAALEAPRRSLQQDPPAGAGLWVADTMGELGLLYRLAPLAFVGRSLTGQGGQNPWEPARLGCAVAVGPHTGNFAEAVAALAAAGGLTQVADAPGLEAWVDAMLRDPARRAAAGAAGQAAATGALDLPARTAQALLELMGAAR
ncbi:MAG TPA: 3-deoxy-D-manno-octulosonic acid transferase [Acetobacteraceae bacterium]